MAIVVPGMDQLGPTIETVIAAVRTGELDELLSQQSKARDIPKNKRAAWGRIAGGKHVSNRELTGPLVWRNHVAVMPALPDTSERNRFCAIRNVPKGCEARQHKD